MIDEDGYDLEQLNFPPASSPAATDSDDRLSSDQEDYQTPEPEPEPEPDR